MSSVEQEANENSTSAMYSLECPLGLTWQAAPKYMLSQCGHACPCWPMLHHTIHRDFVHARGRQESARSAAVAACA